MYLRMTKRRNADGTEVRYYQLAENTWDKERGCAVAKVIYNFGRADEVDGESLRRLAKSILRVFPDEVGSAPAEGLQMLGARAYGGAYVLDKLWSELGIGKLINGMLRAQHVKLPFERALFVMVANRALCPSSKLRCWEHWLAEDVFLPDATDVELQHLYRAMDFLERNKTEIEEAIYFKLADLTNCDVDLIFYDTTSLHFEIDEEDEEELRKWDATYEPLRKRGYSKNGRGDAPQIVVGMAVTRDGLPVRSWVFPGATGDVTTVERVKRDLRGWKLGRCVFVGDAGMNSEDNRKKLSLGGGKYILACRMRAGDEVTKEVLTRPGRYQEVQENLRVKEVIVGEGARRRRYVLCHNHDEEERQRAHRRKILADLTEELESLSQRTDGGHSKRVCELLTSARFGRYLRHTADGRVAIDRAAVTDAERFDGKWVVTSNDDTLSAEDIALGYKQLMRVEECWRTLKSALRMRPVFHFRPWRIQAHVTISVLALLLERIAEGRAADTWRNIASSLETIKVVDYVRDGARIKQTTDVRASTGQILRKLNIPQPPRIHSVARVDPNVEEVA